MKKKLICFALSIAMVIPLLLSKSTVKALSDDDDIEMGWIETHPQYQGEVDEWIERASRDIVLQGNVQGKVNKTVQSTVNEALEELGFAPDTYGNAVYKYIISHDTKGELLSAALEGDYQTMGEKTASLMTEYIVRKITDREGAGDFADIFIDAGKGENLAEQGINLSKAVLKKVFPYIDAMDKFADLVETTRDIWAGDTMEDIYKSYKEKAGDGTAISDDEWNEFCVTNYAAFTVYKNNGMTDEQIRAKFAERASNENKIAQKKIELEKLTVMWDKDLLLAPNYNNYPDGYTVEDRLDSLYKIRQTLITMFTKDGKLQKGSRYLSTDEEFLEEVEFYWLNYGVKDREGFYDWLEDEGITEKGAFDSLRTKDQNDDSDVRDEEIKDEDDSQKEADDGQKNDGPKEEDGQKEDDSQKDEDNDDSKEEEVKYIWYLEDVVVESEPSGNSSFNELYSGEYTGSASSHNSHQEFNSKDDHEKADFVMTWSALPATAEPDEVITVSTSIQASGDTGLIFSDYLRVYCVEYKGEDTYWNYVSAWCDSDGEYGVSASSSEYSGIEKSESRIVSGTLGRPNNDEKRTIIMGSEYSTTYFIYRCKPYDVEEVEKAQELMDKIVD